MQVTITDTGPCRKAMKVELPVDRVEAEYERVLQAYCKQSKISGFRPGKAPRKVVEGRYKKNIVEDIKERLIPQGYHEALEKEKLDAVAILGVSDVSFELGRPLTFTVTLDVPPEFKLPKYKGLSLKGEKHDVRDEDVDAALQTVRAQHANYEDVTDRGIQKGDLVEITYEGVCESKPVQELVPEAGAWAKGEKFWVRSDDDSFLPGLGAGLLGGKIGEKKQVLVDFGADFPQKGLAGKKATYFVDILGIREERLPEMDQEFLEKVGMESEDALRSRIREDLQAMGTEREESRLKNEIVKHLLEKTTCDLPGSLVEHETRSVIYDIVRQNTARGMGEKEIEEKKDEIFQVAARNASERVKLRYILHRIAEEEGVSVSEKDFAEHLSQMAARYGMPPATLRQELEKRNTLENTREDLRMHKTLDFLLEQANVKR